MFLLLFTCKLPNPMNTFFAKQRSDKQGQYMTNQGTIEGKSLKPTIDLHQVWFHPKINGFHLMTPVESVIVFKTPKHVVILEKNRQAIFWWPLMIPWITFFKTNNFGLTSLSFWVQWWVAFFGSNGPPEHGYVWMKYMDDGLRFKWKWVISRGPPPVVVKPIQTRFWRFWRLQNSFGEFYPKHLNANSGDL